MELKDLEGYNELVFLSEIPRDEVTNESIKEFIKMYVTFVEINLALFENTDYMLGYTINKVSVLRNMKNTDRHWNNIPFHINSCMISLSINFKNI